MTTHEDVARQRMHLVIDNRFPIRRQSTFERVSVMLGLLGAVSFIYVVVWPIVCLLFSIE